MARKSNKRTTEPFIQIPHRILNSVAYKQLGAWACKLLIELVKKFNGKNNGDLSYPYSEMKNRGFNSSGTLSEAGKELEHYGLIQITKQPRKSGTTFEKTKLVALTWLPINECKDYSGHHKLEVNASTVAYNQWVKFEPAPDLKKSEEKLEIRRKEQLVNDMIQIQKDYPDIQWTKH